MIIYEVNLSVNKNIFNAYYAWLLDHINDVLKIPGFVSAKVYQLKSDDDHTEKLAVHYFMRSEEDLNHYLAVHATTLRADAIKRFGDQFSAVRRVLHPVAEYNN